MTNHLSILVLHKYTGNRGKIHAEGLEDPHIQMRPFNSIEPCSFMCQRARSGEFQHAVVTNAMRNIQKPKRYQ